MNVSTNVLHEATSESTHTGDATDATDGLDSSRHGDGWESVEGAVAYLGDLPTPSMIRAYGFSASRYWGMAAPHGRAANSTAAIAGTGRTGRVLPLEAPRCVAALGNCVGSASRRDDPVCEGTS